MKSSFSKLKAFNGITVSKFTEVTNTLLKRLSLDCFYHGNVNRKDVDEAVGVGVQFIDSTPCWSAEEEKSG